MRVALLVFAAGALFAQQPILYNRGAVNAASLAPAGLPNAPIAQGSVFTVFGENLGPAASPDLSFPLSSTLGGVSLSVTQAGITTQTFPIFISAGQVNAIMPSTVTTGLATLRLFYQGVKSNAITISIFPSAPGIFAVSGGGYGPGSIQNFVSQANQPVNSMVTPAAPGQVITIWGTGLGPVTFPDNVAPTAGNVATPATLTIGGQRATVAYSGRSPCCAGVDQIVATIPTNAPLGCWVPVYVNAGGVVSNTATMAIAAPGASSCSDPGNPLSVLVRTAGTQAFIHLERVDSVENVAYNPAVLKTLDKIYTRFYTRSASPYAFDPYMSFPPAGSCLVQQTSGEAFYNANLRGALPPSASTSPQPNQLYNNGTQSTTISPSNPFLLSTVGGTFNGNEFPAPLQGVNASFTIDPTGPNKMTLPLNPEPPPGWTRPNALMSAPRNTPLSIAFTPGDTASPTAVLIYSYAAATNSTVEVECLAPLGATTFTISADMLSNLPPTYGLIDGSYTNLLVGTLGLNKAASFTNSLAAQGALLNSNWQAQSLVLQ